MKTMLLALAAATLTACVAQPSTPDAQAVARIQAACAADAALRPTVTVLLAIPGLATPQEVAGVAAARAVIDPICANPSGGVAGNALAAVSGAAGQIVAYVADMQARRQ